MFDNHTGMHIEKYFKGGKINWKKLERHGAESRRIIERNHSKKAFMKEFNKVLRYG